MRPSSHYYYENEVKWIRRIAYLLFSALFAFILGGCSGNMDQNTGNFSKESLNKDNRSKVEKLRIQNWKKDLAADTLPSIAVPLTPEFSFPRHTGGDGEPVFFKAPAALCVEPGGHIFVSDALNHRVLRFDAQGNFLRVSGRKGKGPGDLLLPTAISVNPAGKLVVTDSKNRRFQVFHPDGSHDYSFRTFENYGSIVIGPGGNFYCNPFGPGKPLVRVFEPNGRQIAGFGQPAPFKHPIPGLNRVFLSINPGGQLYAAWELFPFVRRYSTEGTLQAEFKIDYPKMKKNAEFNFQTVENYPAPGNFKLVTTGIRATNNGFYLFCYYPRIEILRFDNDGKLKNVYWTHQPFDFAASDFLVKETPAKRLFYILQSVPEARVSVYSVPVPTASVTGTP